MEEISEAELRDQYMRYKDAPPEMRSYRLGLYVGFLAGLKRCEAISFTEHSRRLKLLNDELAAAAR